LYLPLLSSSTVLRLVLGVDTHAGQETLVTVVVHSGDLVIEQVEHGDLRVLAV
jgi:hypothetical protein